MCVLEGNDCWLSTRGGRCVRDQVVGYPVAIAAVIEAYVGRGDCWQSKVGAVIG